jgi:Flp pilus assembly pilin Flp
MLKRFIADESGQALVEYIMILALVAMVSIAALTTLSNVMNGKIEALSDQMR